MAFIASSEYATINQVVAERDISERKLYYLREQGLLTFYKLGRKNYIRLAELDALLVQDLPRLPKQKIIKSFV